MRKFSEPVDLRSRKEMTDFLQNHFRYPTMNSWNRATSYACNLKIHRLGLEAEIESKLYDMLGTQEFYCLRQDALDLFNEMHDYRWQAAFNGRSGGYLVLYQGELRSSGYPAVGSGISEASPKPVMYAEFAENLPEWISVSLQSNPSLSPVVERIWMKTTKSGPCPNSVKG